MRLWKRFTARLYCLRHPCTIITMEDAPAKGVNVTFSYSGEYSEMFKRESTPGIAPDTYKHLDHVNLFDKTFGNLQEMSQKVQRINMLLETLLECGEHNSKLKFPETTQIDNNALAHVEDCLDSLHTGIMVGLHPQEAALGQWGLESQKKVVEGVKEDFKRLSEAIKALRKEQ